MTLCCRSYNCCCCIVSQAHLAMAEHGGAAGHHTETAPQTQSAISTSPVANPTHDIHCTKSNNMHMRTPHVAAAAAHPPGSNCCCHAQLRPVVYSHAEATCALHIHEKAVGRLYQPLKLVLGPLQLSWRVEQINITVEHLQAKQTLISSCSRFRHHPVFDIKNCMAAQVHQQLLLCCWCPSVP